MHLYNSRTGQVDPFSPAADTVSIYVCGITPYDTTHLGHAFTYTANDVLIRYLEYKGFPVRYVQNVTDVDDDLLRRAGEVGQDWRELGNRWTAHFIEDMKRLNVRPPDLFPRATDVIEGIIDTSAALLKAGVAYEAGGSVYFSVDAWERFGRLSCLDRDEMLPVANERGNDPDDPNKRDPLDFVLWQRSQEGEPSWESPWGAGRPGWHIECSTMATEFLGETIDLHSGGEDLLFPHHECEIAQVEPITGKRPFVRFWVHTAMVRHKGEKMSKSLGNLVMVRDLLQDWSPDALRVYLGRHHYRTPWEHNLKELERSAAIAEELATAAGRQAGSGEPLPRQEHCTAFEAAMDDDLSTREAVDVMVRLANEITGAEGASMREAQEALCDMAMVFGLRLGESGPASAVRSGWDEHLLRFPYEGGNAAT